MVKCLKCGSELEPADKSNIAASMSGSIMGDEHTDTYFLCEGCNVYTVESSFDAFLGDGDVTYRGPVPREEGDEDVATIKKCSEPWNKKCRCDAHRAYFRNQLD